MPIMRANDIEFVRDFVRQLKLSIMYFEPVQLTKSAARLITTKLLVDISKFAITGLTLSGENQKLRTSVFYDDAENCINIELDRGIDFGYFTLEFELFDGVQRERISQSIIVAPSGAWGGQTGNVRNVLAVQLYALRSSSNWGIDDFGDLMVSSPQHLLGQGL